MKKLLVLLTLTAVALTAISCASAAALDKEEAKGVALEHAGISEAEAKGLHIEYDKDGKAKRFEIEFRADGDEYEYEIDADSGEVLKAEKNDRNLLKEEKPTEPPKSVEPSASGSPTDSPAAGTEALITAEEAIELALKDACVPEADIRDLDVELDRERNSLVYEIDFDYERNEYSYDIDAITGEIINKRIEKE